ncbi:MAG: hypothetical protein H7Z18_01570 [Methylophilaceae bacterium]|nr:hypothetical protein [Methylophilaceae bacterium]
MVEKTQQHPEKKSALSSIDLGPIDLAQKILDQLKEEGIEPTPEAFERMYNLLTGAVTFIQAEGVLPQLARRLARSNTDAGLILAGKIENKEWRSLGDELISLAAGGVKEKVKGNGGAATLPHIDSMSVWQEMLERTLKYTVPDLLRGNANLAQFSENLSADVKYAKTKQDIDCVTKDIKSLYFKIHQFSDDFEIKQQSFTRLLYLMIDSIKETINPYNPVHTEIKAFQNLLNEPLDQNRMSQAILRLKEVIFKNRA